MLDGFAVYPRDVFCPVNYSDGRLFKTERTATIHWFAESWMNIKKNGTRKQHLRSQKWEETISSIIHIPNKIGMAILGDERYSKLKQKLKK